MRVLNENLNISEIVSADYRTAAVFRKYGINFCCGGGVPVREMCRRKDLPYDQVQAEIVEAVETRPTEALDFSTLSTTDLFDYLTAGHRRAEMRMGDLERYLAKVAKVHGGHNPKLIEIEEVFKTVKADLERNISEEEALVFKIEDGQYTSENDSEPEVINRLMSDWERRYEAIVKNIGTINELSDGYMPPPHACNTYMVSFRVLSDHEADVLHWVDLKFKYLFPKWVKKEKTT